MAEIKMTGNKRVGTLCKEFKEAFGSTLRVYNGAKICRRKTPHWLLSARGMPRAENSQYEATCKWAISKTK